MGLIDDSVRLPGVPGDPIDAARPSAGRQGDLTARRLAAQRMRAGALAVFIAALALAAWLATRGQALEAFIMAGSGAVLALTMGIVFASAARVIPADLAQSIAAAEAFDLGPVTAAHRAQLGVSEAEAASHEREFRRWAALATLTISGTTHWPLRDGPFIAYSAALAGQPALYRALCAALPGGHAALEVQWVPYAEAGIEYAHLWLAYGFAFGQPPDPATWPPSTYSLLATRQMELAIRSPGLGHAAAIQALYWRPPLSGESG